MSRSGTVTPNKPKGNASAVHALVDGTIQVVEPSILNTTGAASSMTSTASDMAKFMMMMLSQGTYGRKQILRPETVAEIFKRSMTAQVEFSELAPISESTGFFYGLGVGSYDYAGYQIIEKGGALAGVRTVMVLIPARKSGIAILSNLNLTTFPEAVRAFFLDAQLGIDSESHQRDILAKNAQLAKLVAPPPAPKRRGRSGFAPQALVGTYENDYYGVCKILLRNNTLKAQFGPARFEAALTHWSQGAFAMRFPGATQGPAITTFSIGEDGKAASFTHEDFGMFARVESNG
jgi:hypothetical protein